MLAGKIDIGSMGDYPLLINGSRGQQTGDAAPVDRGDRVQPRGALNSVVVTRLADRGLAELRASRSRPASGRPRTDCWCRRCASAGLDPARTSRSRTRSRRSARPPWRRAGRRAGPVRGVAGPARLPGPRRGCSTTAPRSACPPSTASSSATRTPTEQPEVVKAFLRRSRRHRYLHEQAAEGRRERRQGDRAARRGGLPLQRRERHRHLRHHDQAAAPRRPRAGRALPQLDRRTSARST